MWLQIRNIWMTDENWPTLEDRLSKKGDPEAPEPSAGRSERGNKPPINAIPFPHEKAWCIHCFPDNAVWRFSRRVRPRLFSVVFSGEMPQGSLPPDAWFPDKSFSRSRLVKCENSSSQRSHAHFPTSTARLRRLVCSTDKSTATVNESSSSLFFRIACK